MPIRVVVTDLDGTLLGPGMSNYYHFVPSWCDTIERFQRAGGTWVMNTGRTFKKMIEILASQPQRVWPDHMLIQESEIFHRDGNNYAADKTFNEESIKLRRELMQRVLRRLPKWYEALRKQFRIEAIRNHGTEITIVAKTVEDADGIMNNINDWKVEVSYLSCNRNQRVVALMHSSYNKGVIMRRLMQLHKWHRSEVLSIGDSINDTTILDGRTSQHVAAPSNAERPIRKLIQKNNGYVAQNPFGWGSLESTQWFLLQNGQHLEGWLNDLKVEAPPAAFGMEPPAAAAAPAMPRKPAPGAGFAQPRPSPQEVPVPSLQYTDGLAGQAEPAGVGAGDDVAGHEGGDPNDALVTGNAGDHDPNDAVAADMKKQTA